MADALGYLTELDSVIDAIYGVYLDSFQGFTLVRRQVERAQKDTLEQLRTSDPEHATPEYMDCLGFYYGPDPPGSPGAKVLHRATQKALKERNSEGGLNFRFIANMAVIAIYQYWEDNSRGKIAGALGKNKNELESPVFGDIRHLRRSIIHNDGIAVPEVAKSQVIQWYQEGDLIDIDKKQFKELVTEVKVYIQYLRDQASTPQ